MNNEPKISEVLEAVNALSTHIYGQIKELKDDITELKEEARRILAMDLFPQVSL